MVEGGQGVEALVAFYADNATMQENHAPPRVGKAAQAAVTGLKATCVRPVLMAGDVCVIRWVFEYTSKAGKAVRFEELAYQRWQGEHIVEEQFFYDPVQFK